MTTTAKRYLALILCSLGFAAFDCPAATFGVHVASVHVPAKDGQNNTNPGIYIRSDDGWMAGVYRNTIDRTSVYVGKAWQLGPASLGVGGVTGYQERCTVTNYEDKHGNPRVRRDCIGSSRGAVAPMLAISVALPQVQGIRPRLSLLPGIAGSSNAIHLSLEH